MKAEEKKTIIILIAHYLPGYKFGGPITSIVNIVENLSDEFNFRIITSDRDMGDSIPYDNIEVDTWLQKENHEIFYLGSRKNPIFSLIRELKRSPCSAIYLNSLFHPLYSILVVVARKLGIISGEKIIIAPRGELFQEALAFKSAKKALFIRLAKTFNLYRSVIWHASTEEEKREVVRVLNVSSANVHVAINMPAKWKAFSTDSLGKGPDSDQRLKIVYLSRISKDKNVTYTFKVLERLKINVVFHIYGPIEDHDIWMQCEGRISEMPTNVTALYKGEVNRENVREVLSHYDLFFLPTLAENYGNVIAEALSVGTPVLISDNTPWRNLTDLRLGWDINLKNVDKFVLAINEFEKYRIEGSAIFDRKKVQDTFLSSFSGKGERDNIAKLFNKL